MSKRKQLPKRVRQQWWMNLTPAERTAYLERKNARKRQQRRKPPEQKTKFPFEATINGKPVIVWPDRIERPYYGEAENEPDPELRLPEEAWIEDD